MISPPGQKLSCCCRLGRCLGTLSSGETWRWERVSLYKWDELSSDGATAKCVLPLCDHSAAQEHRAFCCWVTCKPHMLQRMVLNRRSIRLRSHFKDCVHSAAIAGSDWFQERLDDTLDSCSSSPVSCSSATVASARARHPTDPWWRGICVALCSAPWTEPWGVCHRSGS